MNEVWTFRLKQRMMIHVLCWKQRACRKLKHRSVCGQVRARIILSNFREIIYSRLLRCVRQNVQRRTSRYITKRKFASTQCGNACNYYDETLRTTTKSIQHGRAAQIQTQTITFPGWCGRQRGLGGRQRGLDPEVFKKIHFGLEKCCEKTEPQDKGYISEDSTPEQKNSDYKFTSRWVEEQKKWCLTMPWSCFR